MKKNLWVLYLFFVSLSILGQQNNDAPLKVGLVLSGGGAKGFAHIGVLKALEEAGVHVDYIGGTSMGSIVGALYASGFSAAEIEKIVLDLNFEDYLDEEISRPDKPFYLKENDDKFAVKLSIQDGKIMLPSGWTNGVQVMNKLSKYLQHVSNVSDFNKLPIPFLCIATNLENGEQALLNHGDLAQSIRASAAFPTLLKPIEIDGKLLVDGGIVNNFPVNEVKNMGANFLIGVEVSSHELYQKEELQSVVNIMEQLVSYQMVTDEIKSKHNMLDIYINPLDDKYSTFSFDKAQEIIQFGYDTAQEKINEFKELASRQQSHKKHYKHQELLNQFTVKSIHFTGSENCGYAYLIDKLQIKLGKTILFEDLFRGINRLWATKNFSQIQHKVVLEGDKGIIFISLQESPKNSHLQLGAHYDEMYQAGIIVNWTRKQILSGNDYLSADVVIGKNLRYNIKYFIDNGVHLSVGIQSTFQTFEFDTHINEDLTTFSPSILNKNLNYQNYANKLYFQYIYRDNFAFGFGGEHQYIRANDLINLNNVGLVENSHFENILTYLKYDAYDNRMFPEKGIYFNAQGKWYFASQSSTSSFKPFVQGNVHFGYAFPLYKKLSAHLTSDAGLSFSKNINPFLDFHLGGVHENVVHHFNNLYGYPSAYMGNNSFLKTSVSVKYKIAKNQYLGVLGNIARIDDNILEDLELFKNTKRGYAVFYGNNTLVGPIQLSLSRSPEVKKTFFNVKMGYWF